MKLPHVRQAGATGIVTALHQIPYGVVWQPEDIERRKTMIEADRSLGLRWSVVESLPIHERVKLGEGDLSEIFGNYRQSMRNLAGAGIKTICYNFMPILDWTRTDLAWPLPGGGNALKFDAVKYCAFDCFMLTRPGAEVDHSRELIDRAHAWFKSSTESDRDNLLSTINAGLPGAYDRYDVNGFSRMLDRYRDVGHAGLRQNLKRFLNEVVPSAEEYGIRLCIHPDDPPRPMFGLARIVSNREDLQFIVDAVPSGANGITFCTGSLGAGAHNNVPELAETFAKHIHFAHLRNVAKEADGSFMEADHLGGDTDMVAVVHTLLREERRRRDVGDPYWQIPFRPDHGHELLDDIGKKSFPGYSAIGRLKGLAEIRGVMSALTAIEER